MSDGGAVTLVSAISSNKTLLVQISSKCSRPVASLPVNNAPQVAADSMPLRNGETSTEGTSACVAGHAGRHGAARKQTPHRALKPCALDP